LRTTRATQYPTAAVARIAPTIAVFVAALIAAGDIDDITFVPLATAALGAGQALATSSLRLLPSLDGA